MTTKDQQPSEEDLELRAMSDAYAGSEPQAAGPADTSSGDGGNAADANQEGANAPGETDPLEGLPDAVKAALARIPVLEQQLADVRSKAGLIPTLQSRMDKFLAAQAPKLERVAKLREDGFPEVADALEEAHEAMANTLREAAKPPPEPPADPQMDVLDDIRPNWADDIRSPEFVGWLAQQPAELQRTVRTTDKAKHILSALAAFDASKQRTTATAASATQRRERVIAAVAPRADGRRAARPSDEDEELAAMEAAFSNRSL